MAAVLLWCNISNRLGVGIGTCCRGCGGNAQSNMTLTDIPHGLEIQVDGGHYWSVDNGKQIGEEYHLHTYCGPEGRPGPGCNVKVKVIGHYKVTQTAATNPH